MQIRAEQVAALESKLLRGFEERMITLLRESFTELTADISEIKLRKFVLAEIAIAREFEIEEECYVATYISAIFALRPDPDIDIEPTWVKEVLADPDSSPSEKVECLASWVEEELEEIASDESA